MQVWHACQVTFANGEDCKGTLWCDVLPMDSGDILLGWPWMYDENGTHGMHDNIYTFVHHGNHVTLGARLCTHPFCGKGKLPCQQIL